MFETKGYAAQSSTSPLAPFSFNRRDPGPRDVQIDIQYCSVCHFDVHTARNDWSGVIPTTYPAVLGHEIVGRVTKVGKEVRKFKEGDLAAVGCLVGSCRECNSCKAGLENYCERGATFTYNSPDKHLSGITYGGYSKVIVVDHRYVLTVPANLDPAAVAPLPCAGATTYSALRHWKVGKGQRVGVVGLGGVGHMALKLANAFGAHVTLFTTSPHKTEHAKQLGAHHVTISKNPEEINKHVRSFDLILDTVSAEHDVNTYLNLLKLDGSLVLLGFLVKPLPTAALNLIGVRRSLSGSNIAGIAETQEMLNFCGEHGITADIEMIPIQKINEAYERLLRSDVKYRFVIDIASLG
jgi:uncharacterized zinc-type alcohol dehydrogenase-like protein